MILTIEAPENKNDPYGRWHFTKVTYHLSNEMTMDDFGRVFASILYLMGYHPENVSDLVKKFDEVDE